MPVARLIPSFAVQPSSDTSSSYTPEYTPASTPQPENASHGHLHMAELSQADAQPASAKTDSAVQTTSSVNEQQQDQQQDQQQIEQAIVVGASKESTSNLKPVASQCKAHSRCKKKAKAVKKSKKRAQHDSDSSSSSSSSSDDDSSSSSDDSSSDSEASDSESSSDSDTSSSSDSSSEEESRKKRLKNKKKALKKLKSKIKSKNKNKSKKSKRRDETSSEESDADDDESSSDSSSDERSKRTKRGKKLEKRQRTRATRSPSTSSSSDSDPEHRRGKKSRGRTKQKSAKKDGNKKPTFFRGDEVWDRNIHQYSVKPTSNRVEKTRKDYVFTVKRRFDWEGKYDDTMVDIHAAPLRDCLRSIMENCQSVSLSGDEPTIEPDQLFLYWEDMRDYRKTLKAELKSGRKLKKKAKKLIIAKIEQLKCMLKYLNKDYAKIKASLYPMLKEGVITFDLLWTIFRSDTIVYSPTYSDDSVPRAFKSEFCTKERSFMRGTWYNITGKYFEYDGKHFGLADVEAEIDSFQGVRKISSLACYPMQYHPRRQELTKELIDRGKKFVSLAGMKYKFMKGLAFVKRRNNVLKINVNGRVMCDPATFRRINPNYLISNVKKEDPSLLPECESDEECSDKEAETQESKPNACNCAECQSSDPNAYAQQREKDDEPKKRWKRVHDKESDSYEYVQVPVDANGIEIRNINLPTSNATGELEALPESGDDKNSLGGKITFSDEELLIASPVILGFAFSEKLWLEMSFSDIHEIQWNEGAFDSLVLPQAQKNIVRALVTAHAAANDSITRKGDVDGKDSQLSSGRETIDDIIQGKGRGLVAVLHGSPGTGKTLTAEGIAELRKCPLYCVSAGELGTSPRDLETELTKILDVAHAWKALLLIDEADIYLEARTPQDIHRNALVGIFLRELEYFQGILFLTTNRVTAFDEAFQSRIHIALRYQELDFKARRKVWDMFLGRVRALGGDRIDEFGKVELDRLARKVLNGRQIKNTVRSAQALAINDQKPLGMTHIDQVLEVADSFDKDLKGGTGYEDALRSYN